LGLAEKIIDKSVEATELRLTPPGVGQVEVDTVGQPAVAAAPAATGNPGQKIYNTVCATCHASGVAGAPKKGDKAVWKARLAAGWDTVMARAINGYKAMPPKGTCNTCTEAELKAAIEFMVQ
jgi:cytochrome c5